MTGSFLKPNGRYYVCCDWLKYSGQNCGTPRQRIANPGGMGTINLCNEDAHVDMGPGFWKSAAMQTNYACRLFLMFFIGSFFQEFACNGTVVEHPEYGEVLQLQGDQRNNICGFLKRIGIAKQEQLKVHGF